MTEVMKPERATPQTVKGQATKRQVPKSQVSRTKVSRTKVSRATVSGGKAPKSKVLRAEELAGEDPTAAAQAVAGALTVNGVSSAWMNRFLTELDHIAERGELARVLDIWSLSKAEAGRVFGVSRQAVDKWLSRGVPDERRAPVADLEATTDLLVRYLKRDRVPAVVRRPAERLGGKSMLDLARAGRTGELLDYTREMFDLRRVTA